MSEQIDWSKAPEGVTHYVVGSVSPFEMRDGDDWFFWSARPGKWVKLHGVFGNERFKERALEIIQRPATQSWSGEGPPPVCEFVEFLQDGFGWRQGMVICCDMGKVIVRHGEQHAVCLKGDVRPLRTPEQIAADEREAAIQEMRKVHNQSIIESDYRDVCPFSVLYDAGYRKP